MPEPAEPPRHLLHVFSTFAVGGPQARFVSLANALGRRYRHTVLAMDDDHAAAKGLDPELDVTFASMPVIKTGSISLRNLRQARGLLRRLRPDLLLTYNWGTIEWALADWPFTLMPHIHAEDGFGPDETATQQNRGRVMMRRFLLRHCERIVVPSHVLYRLATGRWGLPASRVLHVPNGIDCDRFAGPTDPALIAALGLDRAGPVIGTVSGLRPEKNLKRLIRVFAALPGELDARLVIVGDGPERDALNDEARRLRIADRVVMAGAIANPERILGRFDVFSLTSDTEQMPNSVLEAMCAGRAVVATDVGDIKQLVTAENAPFIVPCNPETAITEAMLTLLRDDRLRARIGADNQRHVHAHYRLETMVARYASLYSGREP